MKNYRNMIILTAISLAVIGLLGWSFVKEIRFSDVLAAFRTARWYYLPLALLTGMMVFPVKAYRWQLLLKRVEHAPLRPLLSATMIGFMANCFLSRLGEVVRGVVLSMRSRVTMPVAFASIALERIFDMCTVLLFLVIALLGLQSSAEGTQSCMQLRRTGILLAVAFLAMVGFLVFLRLKPAATTRLVMATLFWLPRSVRNYVEKFMASFLAGLDAIHSVEQVAALFALSVVHWGIQVLFFLLIGYAFPEIHLTLSGAMLIFAVTALGVAAAPLPGYLHIPAVVLVAARILGHGPGAAASWTSYSLMTWALNIPPVIIAGFIFLWAEGLSFKQIRGQPEASKK